MAEIKIFPVVFLLFLTFWYLQKSVFMQTEKIYLIRFTFEMIL